MLTPPSHQHHTDLRSRAVALCSPSGPVPLPPYRLLECDRHSGETSSAVIQIRHHSSYNVPSCHHPRCPPSHTLGTTFVYALILTHSQEFDFPRRPNPNGPMCCPPVFRFFSTPFYWLFYVVKLVNTVYLLYMSLYIAVGRYSSPTVRLSQNVVN